MTRSMKRFVLSLALASCLAPALRGQTPDGARFFENEVRPLMARHCVTCHGPTRQRSGLRLDTYKGLSTVITPGDPDESRLIQRLHFEDPDMRMPPAGPLPAADIETLSEWVRRGAPGPSITAETFPEFKERLNHWSLQPLRAHEPPDVKDEDWVRDPVDRFLLAAMEKEDVTPVLDADRASLARRAAMVLTGLPLKPKDVTAFLANDSPEAFADLVDRLLDSPHFGERWARHWLDVVRYAESRGHQHDFDIPNAHEYRDWVIRALNADVPYDRFVTEQIAGDLVEEPRRHPKTGHDESTLGTGFWFLGEELHAPVDIRRDETDRDADKIDTLSKAFMGLTVACARCHDHMADAISQKDYYALTGFLRSSTYHQVRYETAHVEVAERRRIDDELEKHEGPLRRALAALIRKEVDGAEPYLRAAAAIEKDLDRDRRDQADRIVADFEHETWKGWKVEGDAFGTGPVRLEDAPREHGVIGGRGEAALQTAALRDAVKLVDAEARTGRLLSPPFTIDRDWLHLSIAGGADAEKIAVRLIVGDETVAAMTGTGFARLQPKKIDVRRHHGRKGRLEFVDTATTATLSVDHIVLSNSDDAEATTGRPTAKKLSLMRDMIKARASTLGLEAQRLQRWLTRLQTARERHTHPLHDVARRLAGAESRPNGHRGRDTIPEDATVLLDATSDAVAPIFDGVAWNAHAPGDLIVGNDPRRPIRAVASRAAFWCDPRWSAARAHPTAGWQPGRIDWVQAGLTLRTRSAILKSGRVWYLVRGGGQVYAAVASHRMNHEGLHAEAIKRWKGQDGWKWVEHDLTDYAGQRVVLEFTPDRAHGQHPLAVAMVVESTTPPALDDVPPSISAESLESDLLSLAAALEEPGRPASEALLPLMGWALTLARPDNDPALSREIIAPFFSATRPRLKASRLAPAMLDLNGVDEPLLERGRSDREGDLVPRRFLEALDGPEPMETGAGSGRLALAARVTDTENPLTARVWVNRVWHHLFGRGLVASVDDFGAMGEEPSHPRLLDRIAHDFMADGWSTKRLIRRLLLTRSWGLALVPADPADPENRLLSRASVRRLEGEVIRDTMLAVSGRLDRKMFGPPIPIHFTGARGEHGRPMRSGPEDGARRRSLYIAVRRNFPDPFFHAFDQPPPAQTSGARHESNVPAQALAIMNWPVVRRLAETWARRVTALKKVTEERIELVWRQGLGRPPTDAESMRVTSYLETEAKERDVDLNDRGLWADVCHSIFSLEEFLFLP